MRRILGVTIGLLVTLALAACASQKADMGPPPPERVNLATLPSAASAAAQGDNEITAAILAAFNAYRKEQGLTELPEDGVLQRAAAVHSADMALRNFIGDFNPDGQGVKERVMAAKPGFAGSASENIAALDGTASKSPQEIASIVMKQWTSSPMRRKALKDSSYTATGVGIASKDGKLFVTQVFAGS